ncbi:hypothetical protein V3N99_01180 [Dermatophilaceae bacterium Soc4.6]
MPKADAVDLLDDLGFGPLLNETNGQVVRLTHSPLGPGTLRPA